MFRLNPAGDPGQLSERLPAEHLKRTEAVRAALREESERGVQGLRPQGADDLAAN